MHTTKVVFITDRMILGHGVDLVIDKLATGLSGLGYECEIYCNNFDETFRKQRPFDIRRLPNISGKNFIDLESKTKKLKLILNNLNADIFIINSFPFYSLAGHLNKPVISINYGVISTQGLPLKRKLFYKYMDLSQNYFYFRNSSKIISISSYLDNKLPSYLRNKSDYIHLGSNHYLGSDISTAEIRSFRKNFNISEDDCLLLYVGRLNPVNQPYKGTKQLIDLFHQAGSRNSRIKLMMVGFGSGNDEIAIKNEGILSIANAPWEIMPLIYSSCDIYTTCTQWEGFDLPIVEAHSFGKPSICYDLCAHPEISKNLETGFLVRTSEEFLNRILELAGNAALRNQMGLSAKDFSKNFTWEKTVYQYDKAIKTITGISEGDLMGIPDETQKPQTAYGLDGINIKDISEINTNENELTLKGPDPEAGDSVLPDVSVIIVNYNSSLPCLNECISSLQAQTYRKIEIIVFDNGSTNNVCDSLQNSIIQNNTDNSGGTQINREMKDIKIRIIRNHKNEGLGSAINKAIKSVESKYVLISNFDVKYDKNAVEELVAMINSTSDDIIGLAPKIKLSYQKNFIESVGTYLDPSFYDGYQGLGQLDLHQYDVPENIFGLSFTSAFLRTSAFLDSCVGKVDETFFLFYEDFDFCFRADLAGYRFMSCPQAVVYHKYSYSFREESDAFEVKYYYKRLNLLKMMLKNAQKGTIERLLPIETGIMKQNLKDRNLRKVSRRIMIDFNKAKKYLLKQRELIQLKKIVNESEIIKYCWGESNFFDVIKNEPEYKIINLEKTYRRLFAITGAMKYMEYINYLNNIEQTKFKFETQILRQKLHSKLENEPVCVHDFIDNL
ncbi:MAG: glycosyltransferase [Candidatus Humimicrobiaceae bacterium]